MRTRASLYSLIASWAGQGLAIVMQFVVRMVFVRYLAAEYLGLSGLFTNLLSMLSLVELGIGPAMTFSLYKPLAENDREKVKSLMRLYKRTYIVVGVAILFLGLVCVPVYPYLIKDLPNIPHLDGIYLLFVLNTGISYFYSYKRSIIITDQKRHIEQIVHYGFYTGYNLIQIVVLVVTQNYLLFLACQVAGTFLENLVLSHMADAMYPYLREKNVAKLPDEDMGQIKRNVFAMIFHKVGTIVVTSTSNILISRFIGLVVAGLYSNYQMITTALNTVVGQLFTSLTASVGNLNALEGSEKVTSVFYRVFFLNFWVFGFCSIALLELVQPFISLWIGGDFLLDEVAVLWIVLNFYTLGMRKAVLTFRDATGCYYYDRYKPVAECVVNFGLSLLLINVMGIAGLMLAGVITNLFICTWVEAYVLYHHVLHQPLWGYFRRYILYTLVIFVAGICTHILCGLVTGSGYGVLLIRGVICALVPNLIFLAVFWRSEEFRYFWNLVMTLPRKLLHREK